MTEAEYICFLAKNISRGIYQSGGFCVLPYFVNNLKAVYFPDLGYSSDFWNEIKKCKSTNLGENYPKIAVQEVVSRLKTDNFSALVKDSEFDYELLNTEYGTVGSYFVKGLQVFITQRVGNSRQDLEKTLLLAKLKLRNKDNVEIGEIGWHKRQAVADYFYVAQKSKLSLSQIKDSEKYLTKLGFPDRDTVFKVSQWGKVTINGKDINQIFTPQEEQTIKFLLKNKGEIVGFNDFENAPSLYALAKVIENIRKKIRDLGLNKEVITTVRGKGYLLNF